jgi:DeoR/GlpR family transcriptional regulator of sugar metabolism
MHTWLTVYYAVLYLSLLHVSTPNASSSGSSYSLPAKIHKRVHAVFADICHIAVGGVYIETFTFIFLESLKHQNCRSYNKLYCLNNSRKFSQVAVCTICNNNNNSNVGPSGRAL